MFAVNKKQATLVTFTYFSEMAHLVEQNMSKGLNKMLALAAKTKESKFYTHHSDKYGDDVYIESIGASSTLPATALSTQAQVWFDVKTNPNLAVVDDVRFYDKQHAHLVVWLVSPSGSYEY